MRFNLSSRILLMTVIVITISCKHTGEGIPPSAGSGGTGGGTGGGSGGGTGSGGSTGTTCDPNKIYFQQQVLPVLISNCAMSGCHDAASHQDGVVLTSYASVMATADVRPGRPDDSDLYEMITETDPDDRMPPPPRSPLSSTQILMIRQWIEKGALNLSCQSSGCDTTSATFTIVKSIISAKCQGCHSGTAASGGIDLGTYAGVKARVDDGRLWGAINHLPGYSPMPKNGNKLSDCEIAQFRKWIEAGSPNN
jgi:hypothetical protein